MADCRLWPRCNKKISDTEAILEVVIEDQIAQANDGSGTETQLAYCSGFDFASVVDGGGFAFPGSVACKQTKTYRTAIGGSKTIPLLEPIDLSGHVAKETQRRQDLKRRKWTDRTGTFSVAAIFLGQKEGKVTLLKEDGTEVVVPLSSLSPSDQEYIRKEIATRKAKD